MSEWTGAIDWSYVEEQPTISNGARMVVRYADDRPDENFIIDDVQDHKDGTQTLSVHLDGLDASGSFLWHPARDQSEAER